MQLKSIITWKGLSIIKTPPKITVIIHFIMRSPSCQRIKMTENGNSSMDWQDPDFIALFCFPSVCQNSWWCLESCRTYCSWPVGREAVVWLQNQSITYIKHRSFIAIYNTCMYILLWAWRNQHCVTVLYCVPFLPVNRQTLKETS